MEFASFVSQVRGPDQTLKYPMRARSYYCVLSVSLSTRSYVCTALRNTGDLSHRINLLGGSEV